MRLTTSPCSLTTSAIDWTKWLLLSFFLLLLLAQLSTAPPLWWDEGWTLTVARNWVETGHYGRFLAGAPISPQLAAAPPVVLPVAFSFRLLGIGAWQGRLPGVIFTGLTLWLLYRLTATLYSRRTGVAGLVLALLTPMAPDLHPLLVGKQVLGEMPALCFLLAGYLLLFGGLEENRITKIVGAGLLWSVAVVTKLQVIPFLTVSVAVTVIVLFRQRSWRILMGYAIPFLVAAAAFLTWRWFASTQLAAYGPEGPVNGLLGVSAFVPAPSARLLAVLVTVIGGLPVVASLAYEAPHHLDLNPHGIQRLAVWALAASWFAWYLLLSIGWVRYLFPAAFLSLVFFAGLVRDATDDFNPQVFQSIWQRLRTRQWRRLTQAQKLATFLVLLAVPASLASLTSVHLQADDSIFQLAEYLNTEVPSNTLIETYDPEIMFLTDHQYHYPPDQVHVALNRRTYLGDRTIKIDYDPLAEDPDYLIVGPFSRRWNLYGDVLNGDYFTLLANIERYTIYQRQPQSPTAVSDAGQRSPISPQRQSKEEVPACK